MSKKVLRNNYACILTTLLKNGRYKHVLKYKYDNVFNRHPLTKIVFSYKESYNPKTEQVQLTEILEEIHELKMAIKDLQLKTHGVIIESNYSAGPNYYFPDIQKELKEASILVLQNRIKKLEKDYKDA